MAVFPHSTFQVERRTWLSQDAGEGRRRPRGDTYSTPLNDAAERGQPEVMSAFIEAGSNTNCHGLALMGLYR